MPRLLMQAPQQLAPMPRTNPNAYGAQIGAEMDQTGRTAQALGQVVGQWQETESRVAAVRYEQALQNEANQISLDPDIASRPQKFEAARQRLFAQFQPKWGSQSTYDSRAGLATMDVSGRFEHATMLDAIKQSRANNATELDHWATKAANSETEDEAISYLATAKETLESGNLYYSTAEKAAAEQDTLAKSVALMAQRNSALARRVYDRFSNVLTPEQQTTLSKSLKTEGVEQAAQSYSDQFFDLHGQNATEDQMLKWTRANVRNPEERAAAEQRISTVISLHNRAEGERQNELENIYAKQVGDAIAAAADDPGSLPAQRNDFRRQMENAGLDHSRIESVLNDLDNAAKGTKVVTDQVYYDDVMTHPEKIGQEGYTDAQLARKLAPEQLGQVMKLKRDIEQGMLPNQQAISSRISLALDQEGYKSTDPKRGTFRSQIQGQIDAMARPPTAAEIDSITASVIQAASKAGTLRVRPDLAESDLIEEAQTKDPGLYRFAVWNASRGGTIVATPTQIASQVAVMQRELDRKRATLPKEQYDRLLMQMQKEGNHAAAILSGQGYENADETLMIDDAFRRDFLTKPEGSW